MKKGGKEVEGRKKGVLFLCFVFFFIFTTPLCLSRRPEQQDPNNPARSRPTSQIRTFARVQQRSGARWTRGRTERPERGDDRRPQKSQKEASLRPTRGRERQKNAPRCRTSPILPKACASCGRARRRKVKDVLLVSRRKLKRRIELRAKRNLRPSFMIKTPLRRSLATRCRPRRR